MITPSNMPAPHAGKGQPLPAAVVALQADAAVGIYRAPWAAASAGLLAAAKKLASDWLQDERDDAGLCIDPDHHAAVVGLFAAIAQAEAVDLAAERDAARAAVVAEPQYWYTVHPEYEAKSVAELINNNALGGFDMHPGDAVYVAEIRRHSLTASDLAAAQRYKKGSES